MMTHSEVIGMHWKSFGIHLGGYGLKLALGMPTLKTDPWPKHSPGKKPRRPINTPDVIPADDDGDVDGCQFQPNQLCS